MKKGRKKLRMWYFRKYAIGAVYKHYLDYFMSRPKEWYERNLYPVSELDGLRYAYENTFEWQHNNNNQICFALPKGKVRKKTIMVFDTEMHYHYWDKKHHWGLPLHITHKLEEE